MSGLRTDFSQTEMILPTNTSSHLPPFLFSFLPMLIGNTAAIKKYR
ncbi:hypothetical protein PM8797T_28629 [Gimesia maris DSM 8797]|nr:hypothetical protein PM8797T_28629 [Gimesia maris DSM 8797]